LLEDAANEGGDSEDDVDESIDVGIGSGLAGIVRKIDEDGQHLGEEDAENWEDNAIYNACNNSDRKKTLSMGAVREQPSKDCLLILLK
jgi:hypothetical protein